MSESQELPSAIINRIIKASLPENVQIAKESKLAISKAAKVWIHYITAASIDYSQHSNRSTILPKDVIQALEEIDFQNFTVPLEEFLVLHKKNEKEREKEKEKEKDSNNNKDSSSKDSKDNKESKDSKSSSSKDKEEKDKIPSSKK